MHPIRYFVTPGEGCVRERGKFKAGSMRVRKL